MITLTLENIRCFGKQRVTFDQNTFTLISGPSGVGKSTLFMALTFAITGDSKHLCSLGKRKCQVTLETPDITITRSKGPNKLVVKVGNVTYEEKVAQGYINQAFPNFELGYIPQKLHKSFLAKTAAQKLEFIESFAFDLEYLTKLVTNCKNLLSERKLAYTKAQQHLSTSESLLLKHNIPKVTKQPCTETLEELEEELYQVTQELEQCTENIVVTRERVSQRKEAQAAYEKLACENDRLGDHSIANLKTLLRTTTEKELQWTMYLDAVNNLNQLPVPDKDIDITVLRQELNTLSNNQRVAATLAKKQSCLEQLKAALPSLSSLPIDTSLDTLSRLSLTLHEYVQAHQQAINCDELRTKLKVAEDDLCKQNKFMLLKCKLSDQVKVLELRQELKRLEDLKVKLTKVQQCPHCHELVSIWNGTLVRSPKGNQNVDLKLDQSLQDQQADLDKQIQAVNLATQLESRHPNYIEPTLSYAELSNELEMVKAQQLSTKDLDKLKSRVYRLSSKTSKADYQGSLVGSLLSTLKQEFQVHDDPLLLAKNISKVKAMTLEVHNLAKVIENLEEQLTLSSKALSLNLSLVEVKELLAVTEPYAKAQEKVQLYKCSRPVHNSKDLEQTLQNRIRLEELTKVLKQTTPEFDLEDLSKTQEQLQGQVRSLKSNLGLIRAYTMWHDVSLAKDSVTQAETALGHSYKLQGLITEAKKEALDEVLSRMTTYTQMYLDEFFSEQISLDITFTDKVVLNLELQKANGPPVKIDLDALSGGEFARVNLAINLALAEMYQVDLLLMDESLASLDLVTSTKVLKAIKTLYQGTVLCVAHQTVTGTFDRCVEL